MNENVFDQLKSKENVNNIQKCPIFSCPNLLLLDSRMKGGQKGGLEEWGERWLTYNRICMKTRNK